MMSRPSDALRQVSSRTRAFKGCKRPPQISPILRKAGLIWGGRLHPLKARVLLETCLRARLGRDTIAEVFDAFG